MGTSAEQLSGSIAVPVHGGRGAQLATALNEEQRGRRNLRKRMASPVPAVHACMLRITTDSCTSLAMGMVAGLV